MTHRAGHPSYTEKKNYSVAAEEILLKQQISTKKTHEISSTEEYQVPQKI
jgi:hypothetical protein